MALEMLDSDSAKPQPDAGLDAAGLAPNDEFPENSSSQPPGSSGDEEAVGGEIAEPGEEVVVESTQTGRCTNTAVFVDESRDSLEEHPSTPGDGSGGVTIKGESATSDPSESPEETGLQSMLCQGDPSSDTSVQPSDKAVSDAESAKMATALKEGQVAEEFFRETASQLTYYGLSRLHEEVRATIYRMGIIVVFPNL